METTEKKKKHNGGYYLKAKIAKLENELAQAESARNNYSAQLDHSRTDVHNLTIEVKELKEKLAKADAKNAELQKEKEILVQTAQDNYCRVEKERDEWKAKWQQADAAKQDAVDKYNRKQEDYDSLMQSFKIDEMRIAFLLNHCPFWVRWMYRKQFEKGGKQ